MAPKTHPNNLNIFLKPPQATITTIFGTIFPFTNRPNYHVGPSLNHKNHPKGSQVARLQKRPNAVKQKPPFWEQSLPLVRHPPQKHYLTFPLKYGKTI